jgi:phosphoglycolate phosphatase-like HAD superfamily hydrolase
MSAEIKTSMNDLQNMEVQHDSFAGIDSDGCVFDSMAVKQKLCFHGLIASHWNLREIEPVVRECAEFVNLYSKWRGQNRFIALLQSFDFLREHPNVGGKNLDIPELTSLRHLVESGKVLSNAVLQAEAESTQNPELLSLLSWSLAVNAAIEEKARNIPPFPWALKCLKLISSQSDAICVSQTPTEALVREWIDNDITGYVKMIAGQELGTKTEHLEIAAKDRYPPDRILMIGDADGDRKAADAVGACFYPINPGQEDASWRCLHEEAYDRFLNGTFAGEYQQTVSDAFYALLPEIPPWQ